MAATPRAREHPWQTAVAHLSGSSRAGGPATRLAITVRAASTQIIGRSLPLQELQIGELGAEEYRRIAERLANCLAEVVLDIGPCLRVPRFAAYRTARGKAGCPLVERL